MDISASDLKQKRLASLARGVKAAAWTIEKKFSDEYGHPEFVDGPKGRRYSRHSPYRCALITLTYRQDGMWEPSQVSKLVQHYRMWFKRRGLKFHCVWVMELTQQGRPHYHLVVSPGLSTIGSDFVSARTRWPHFSGSWAIGGQVPKCEGTTRLG